MRTRYHLISLHSLKNLVIILLIISIGSCDFKSSEDYNAEAEKLEQQGEFKKAIPLLDKAIEKDPENIYALINRGVDKAMLKNYKGAIEDYSRIIEIDPDNTLAYVNRGKNKKRLDDFEGAIEDFESAIKIKGGEFLYLDKVENSFVETDFEFDVAMEEIRFERGLARLDIDSLKLAFEDLNFCIHKNFELPASYYWRGIIFITYGKLEEGCRDLNQAKEMGDPDAQEMITEYCEK